MNLLQTAKYLASEEKRIASELIPVLAEIQKSMLYAEIGYPNLFAYISRELGYSESAIHRRLSAVKLFSENAAVSEKIRTGELTLSNASKLVTIFKAAEKQKVNLPKEEMFQAALRSSTREAERKFAEIAGNCGMEIKRPFEGLREKIEKVKAIHSHKHPGMTDEELFALLLDKGIAKAETQGNTGRGKTKSDSRFIPAQMKRAVRLRDKNCCTYLDQTTGRRCCSMHLLQFHHVIPFALGGETTAENLTMHCHAHNKLEARRAGLAI